MTRSLVVLRSIAVSVGAASVLSLGIDLAQTAYSAARVAQTVVLANDGGNAGARVATVTHQTPNAARI